MNKIKEKRIELDISQARLSELLHIPKRTIENWDSDKNSRYPSEWMEKLILEKMDSLTKKKSGIILLDAIQDCEAVFSSKEAASLARLAIKCQLAYYKDTNVYYNYTPEILEETLKRITPKNMGDKPLTVAAIIQKIENLTVFIY